MNSEINFIQRSNDIVLNDFHFHACWELVYCKKGKIKCELENEKFEIFENQLAFIKPQLKHRFSATSKDTIFYSVVSENYKAKFPSYFVLTDNPCNDLLTIIERAYAYFCLDPFCSKKGISSAFSALFFSQIDTMLSTATNNEYIFKVAYAIISNLSNTNFSFDDLYSKMQLSKEYVRKLFIKEKGLSPLQLLNTLRIWHACVLLQAGTYQTFSIGEVSKMSGFADQLYFSRVFKKIIGQSPSDYLKDTVCGGIKKQK
ncbi:MAG: AraC family transcriptional regulator [Clostridia bacterium]